MRKRGRKGGIDREGADEEETPKLFNGKAKNRAVFIRLVSHSTTQHWGGRVGGEGGKLGGKGGGKR